MTAEVIPFDKPNLQELKCSFCGKEESKAKLFWHSETTGKCVCSDCIVKCKGLLDEQRA